MFIRVIYLLNIVECLVLLVMIMDIVRMRIKVRKFGYEFNFDVLNFLMLLMKNFWIILLVMELMYLLFVWLSEVVLIMYFRIMF